MRKILFSIITIVAAVSIATQATQAYFTSVSTVANNTLATGKLKIILRAEGGSVLPINLTDLRPSVWSSDTTIGIENPNTPTSTMPLKYKLYPKNLTESVSGLNNLIWVRVRHTFAGTPGTWPIVWSGKLGDLDIRSTVNSITQPTGNLNINNTHVYKLEFMVDSSADYTYHGAQSKFDLEAFGTQLEGAL